MGVSEAWVGLIMIPATVGEFWMIGYLLILGIKQDKSVNRGHG
jgi:hypothetical protein